MFDTRFLKKKIKLMKWSVFYTTIDKQAC